MGCWLGIDLGSRRIGIAVGNTTTGIASPLEVIAAEPFREAVGHIARVAGEYGAEGIVVGWPLNMDDTEGEQGRSARATATRIAAETHRDVRMWDERLSSFAADQSLAGKLTRKKRRAHQDAITAAEILQDFLSSGGPQGAPRVDEIDD